MLLLMLMAAVVVVAAAATCALRVGVCGGWSVEGGGEGGR